MQIVLCDCLSDILVDNSQVESDPVKGPQKMTIIRPQECSVRRPLKCWLYGRLHCLARWTGISCYHHHHHQQQQQLFFQKKEQCEHLPVVPF
jgi:hypothetical protein